MKQIYFLFLFLTFSYFSFGQNTDKSFPLGAAYVNYSLDGHGVMINTERIIKDKYVIEAALTAYKNDYDDQSISFNAYFSRRFNYQSGFSPQFGLGIGLVNIWSDNEITPGQIIDEESAGDLAFATSMKVTPFGWDFRTKKDFPVRIFVDCILLASYPEFEDINADVLFQFGASYYFRYSSSTNEKKLNIN